MDELMKGLSDQTDGSDNEEIPSDDETLTQDVDERSHARLLDAISSLDGKKRLHHTLRTIHGQNVSEFGFKSLKVDTQSLMTEMMGSLHQSSSHSELKKQLKAAYKSTQVVDTPLPKHITQKAHRAVAYEKSVTEVSKWDPVVTANRKAPQLKFPLEQANQKLINTHITFRPVTDLEKAVRAELAKVKPEHQIHKGRVFTPAEEEEMKAMSLEEARERRAQLLSMRSLLYNKNSKLRWQNKIKSKRYRMIRKKEKLNKERKEMEELALRDPQALVDTMQETEKRRVEERGRLRHRGGKKFARQAKIFAKYDDEKRQQIQDMLAKHKELTKKQRLPSSSESEDDDDIPPQGPASGPGYSQTKNAWMRPAAPPSTNTGPAGAATTRSKMQATEDSADDEEQDKEKKFLESFDLVDGEDEDDRMEKERRFLAALESDSSDDVDADKDEPSQEETEPLPSEHPAPSLPHQLRQDDKPSSTEKTGSLKTQTRKKKKRNSQEPSQKQTQPPEDLTPSPQQQKDKPNNTEERTGSLKTQTGKVKQRKQSPEHKLPSSTAEKDTASQEAGEDMDGSPEQSKLKRKKKKNLLNAQSENEDKMTQLETNKAPSSAVDDTTGPENEEQPDSPMEQVVSTKKKRKRSKKQKKERAAAAATGISLEEQKLMAVVKGLKASESDKPGVERKTPGSARRKAKQPDSTSQSDFANQPDESGDDKSQAAKSALITIAEAFDDDDVVEEFVAEKRRVAEEEAEKDVDLFVPGWGSWGGAGIVPSAKRRERFIKKAEPKVRTDNSIGHVIISEKKNTAVEKHMPKKVPYPYKSLEHMQSVLQKPIGRDFTSESQFKKNIKPRTVVNRIGQIIQPINEKALLHGGQKRKAADISLDTTDSVKLDGKRQRGRL